MFLIGTVLVYLTALALVGVFVVEPTTLGWIGFGVVAAAGLAVGGVALLLFPRTRTNAPRLHPRLDEGYRLLVVADTGCDGDEICRAVERVAAGRTGEVLVLAPVIASPLHYLTDAEESERADARARLTDVVQRLARLGVAAQGSVGDDDPLQAIGDALAGFQATEIVLVAPEGVRRSWLERDLERRARDVFGVHVTSVAADRAGSNGHRPV